DRRAQRRVDAGCRHHRRGGRHHGPGRCRLLGGAQPRRFPGLPPLRRDLRTGQRGPLGGAGADGPRRDLGRAGQGASVPPHGHPSPRRRARVRPRLLADPRRDRRPDARLLRRSQRRGGRRRHRADAAQPGGCAHGLLGPGPPRARRRRARQRQRRGGRSGRGGGPDPGLREHGGQRDPLGGQPGRRGRRGHAAAWDHRGRQRTMSEGSDAEDPTLLGIGTWTKQGPATLVLRKSAWAVLVPGLRKQVIEAAWTVLGEEPAPEDFLDRLVEVGELESADKLTALLFGFHDGTRAVFGVKGSTPIAVYTAEGSQQLAGTDEEPFVLRSFDGVRRAAFGDLPLEDGIGAPRVESGIVPVRGFVHVTIDPAELEESERAALAEQVETAGRRSEPPETKKRRPDRPAPRPISSGSPPPPSRPAAGATGGTPSASSRSGAGTSPAPRAAEPEPAAPNMFDGLFAAAKTPEASASGTAPAPAPAPAPPPAAAPPPSASAAAAAAAPDAPAEAEAPAAAGGSGATAAAGRKRRLVSSSLFDRRPRSP